MPIDRLIVVSGPKAVGKSHLMECIQRGAVPALVEGLEIGDPLGWEFASGTDFQDATARAKAKESVIERLILHYEITGPWNPRYYARCFADDRPLELLGLAKTISHVVLWAPCEVLMSRFLARNPRFDSRWEWLRKIYHLGFQIRKLDADFRPLYRDPNHLVQIYQDWIGFCCEHAPGGFWLVNSTDVRFSLARLDHARQDLVTHINDWTKAFQNATLSA